MMLIEGFRVLAESDSAYSVSDTRRTLGGVVRYWVPAPDGRGAIRRFRAFGEDFDTLREAVTEFLKIPGVRLYDAKGDAP